MKRRNLYAFIFILSGLNFSTNFTQEENYESIGLTADDLAALESLNQQFIQAVKNNDLTRTKQLISQGADINYQDELGNTAAHYAWSTDTNLFSPYVKIRGILTIAKANLNIPNINNKTANDFLSEIKLPFINMNSHEIADSLESMVMKNKISSIQPKIEAEAHVNEEFKNFIHNKSFTYKQFDELVKALDENNITEYIQQQSNQL